MNNHNDFTFVPEPASPVTPSSSQQAKNDLAHRAASASYRIRSSEPDPKRWGPLIQALPDEIRDCAREYLAQHYRSMKDRERIAAGGKRSERGDAAIAELAKTLHTDPAPSDRPQPAQP